jgi:dCTP deaminase
VTFWSGERLKAEGRRLHVVYGFNPKKIDCSAYTLTLGPEAFVTPDYSAALRDSLKLQLTETQDQKVGRKKARSKGGEVVIPAGQFAILLTEEFVKIPTSTMGFISLKFSIKGTGLINVSGFHVDPGYEGRLIFSVYNAGPTAINMTRGQDLFLLWLADLDRTSGPPYVKTPPEQLPASIPEDMVSKANHRIRSLQQLSERLDDLDRELALIKTVTKFLIAALGAAGVLIAAIRFFGESPVVNGPPSNSVTTEMNDSAEIIPPSNVATPQLQNQIGNGS